MLIFKFAIFFFILIVEFSSALKNLSILKLRIPFNSLNSYHDILAQNPEIDEVLSAKLALDDLKSYRDLYSEWIIKKNLNIITKSLSKANISFDLVEWRSTRFPRSKRSYLYLFNLKESSFSRIRSNNLTHSYYSVNQIYEWMDHLEKEYSNVVEQIEIGQSVFNKSIRVLKIGYKSKTDQKLNFWYDSGIHAREWTSIAASLYTIDKILSEQSINGSIMNKFLKMYNIYYLVVLNPDGYDYSQTIDFLWRKNLRNVHNSTDECFGVDLNRNFNYHWMKTGASNDTCSDIYAGDRPASEPEVEAVQNFILSKKNQWISFITLHSYGGFWLHHWEKKHKDLTKSNYIKICHKAKYSLNGINKRFKNHRYSFGIPSKLLSYDASGASDTWAMMVANITYAFTIELGPIQQELNNKDFTFGFHVKEHRIEYIVERAFIGVREYMRSFVDRISQKYSRDIEKQCSEEYHNLMQTFSGYWS